MAIIEIFGILLIHWFADFVLQTHWQATNKSTNTEALLMHTVTYSMVWYIASIAIGALCFYDPIILLFAPITFVCHTVTDYYTSRLNSYLWKKGDYHNFFVSVGFDQMLHYAQLILTYKLLT